MAELFITIDCDDDCLIIPRGKHRFEPTSYFTAKVNGSDKVECRTKAKELLNSLEAVATSNSNYAYEVNDYIARATKALFHAKKHEFMVGGNRTVKWNFPSETSYTVEF